MDWNDYDFADLRESLKYEYKLMQYGRGFFDVDKDDTIYEFKDGIRHTESFSTIHLSGNDMKVKLILKELQPLALCMAYKILDSFITQVLSKEKIKEVEKKNCGYKVKEQLLRKTPIHGPLPLQKVMRLTRILYSYYREDRGEIMHQKGLDMTKYNHDKLDLLFLYTRLLLDFTEVDSNLHDVYLDSLLAIVKQVSGHGKLIKVDPRFFEIKQVVVIDNNLNGIVDISCAKKYFQKESDLWKMNFLFDLTVRNNNYEYFFPAHKVQMIPDIIDLNIYRDYFVKNLENNY